MPRKVVAAGLVLGLILAGSAGPAWAEAETGVLIVTKLFRGIANAATGWMEIPKQICMTWQESGPSVGVTWGFIKGIGYAIGRSVAGGFEIATFPLPVPADYKPLMEPEYVLADLPTSREKEK